MKLYTEGHKMTEEQFQRFQDGRIEPSGLKVEVDEKTSAIRVSSADKEIKKDERFNQADPIRIDDYGFADIDEDGDLDFVYGNWEEYRVAYSQEVQIDRLEEVSGWQGDEFEYHQAFAKKVLMKLGVIEYPSPPRVYQTMGNYGLDYWHKPVMAPVAIVNPLLCSDQDEILKWVHFTDKRDFETIVKTFSRLQCRDKFYDLILNAAQYEGGFKKMAAMNILRNWLLDNLSPSSFFSGGVTPSEFSSRISRDMRLRDFLISELLRPTKSDEDIEFVQIALDGLSRFDLSDRPNVADRLFELFTGSSPCLGKIEWKSKLRRALRLGVAFVLNQQGPDYLSEKFSRALIDGLNGYDLGCGGVGGEGGCLDNEEEVKSKLGEVVLNKVDFKRHPAFYKYFVEVVLGRSAPDKIIQPIFAKYPIHLFPDAQALVEDELNDKWPNMDRCLDIIEWSDVSKWHNKVPLLNNLMGYAVAMTKMREYFWSEEGRMFDRILELLNRASPLPDEILEQLVDLLESDNYKGKDQILKIIRRHDLTTVGNTKERMARFVVEKPDWAHYFFAAGAGRQYSRGEYPELWSTLNACAEGKLKDKDEPSCYLGLASLCNLNGEETESLIRYVAHYGPGFSGDTLFPVMDCVTVPDWRLLKAGVKYSHMFKWNDAEENVKILEGRFGIASEIFLGVEEGFSREFHEDNSWRIFKETLSI